MVVFSFSCLVLRIIFCIFAGSNIRGPLTGLRAGDRHKKALSQRLICGTQNLANSMFQPHGKAMFNAHWIVYSRLDAIVRVRPNGSSIGLFDIQQRGLRHCLSSVGRQCESLVYGMSDDLRFPRFFYVALSKWLYV